MMSSLRTEVASQFTWRSVLLGLVLGALFGASNAYIGLHAGITVPTSIPISVVAAMCFRRWSKANADLETNAAQTIGSTSNSIATGMAFTAPILLLLPAATAGRSIPSPSIARIALLGLAGAVLGILVVLPLRKILIEDMDRRIPFKEGTATASIIRLVSQGAPLGRWVISGLGIAFALKILMALLLKQDAWLARLSPAFLGLGYILGASASAQLMAGGVVGLVLWLLAAGCSAAASATRMEPEDCHRELVLWLLVAGTCVECLRRMYQWHTGRSRSQPTAPVMRPTFRRIATSEPATTAIVGMGGVVVLAVLFGVLHEDLSLVQVGIVAVLISMLSVAFAVLSTLWAGAISLGTTPTSAISLLVVVFANWVLHQLHWVKEEIEIAVTTLAAVVSTAASKSADFSHSLKTGSILKSSHWAQACGQILSAVVTCWVVAAVVVKYTPHEPSQLTNMAPTAHMLAHLLEVTAKPLTLSSCLVVLGLALSSPLIRVSPLLLAIGAYLPLDLVVTISIGGVLGWITQGISRRVAPDGPRVHDRSKILAADRGSPAVDAGQLCAAGLIAGESIACFALIFLMPAIRGTFLESLAGNSWVHSVVACSLFAVAVVAILVSATKSRELFSSSSP